MEYAGGVGFLKAGIWYAERITTRLSYLCSGEILTPKVAWGLDGLLRGRAGVLSRASLNGLDTRAVEPARRGPLLPAH